MLQFIYRISSVKKIEFDMVFSYTHNHWFSNRKHYVSFHNSLFWHLLVTVPKCTLYT